MDAILYRALARAERDAPRALQGAFIPIGGNFTAHAAISEVLETATMRIVLVDPYADIKILSDFAILATGETKVGILADEVNVKPTLKPAATAWKKEYGDSRPLEIRLAQAKSLHDRLILVDDQHVWNIGQSFKDIGLRSPTSLQKLDTDTARLKIRAYQEIWDRSSEQV